MNGTLRGGNAEDDGGAIPITPEVFKADYYLCLQGYQDGLHYVYREGFWTGRYYWGFFKGDLNNPDVHK